MEHAVEKPVEPTQLQPHRLLEYSAQNRVAALAHGEIVVGRVLDCAGSYRGLNAHPQRLSFDRRNLD
jgi:hypothetical protein